MKSDASAERLGWLVGAGGDTRGIALMALFAFITKIYRHISISYTKT